MIQSIKQSLLNDARVIYPQPLCNVTGELSFQPVGLWILNEPSLIEMIATWREDNKNSFFEVFPKSYAGTYNYLKRYSIEDPGRILFLLSHNGRFVGHAGLSNITKAEAHLDNILRGSDLPPGTMHESLSVLIKWATDQLGIKSFRLQVKKDNVRAIALYKKLGFIENKSSSEAEPQNDSNGSFLNSGNQHLGDVRNSLRLWMSLHISN